LIIKDLAEIMHSDRRVQAPNGNWESRRLLLKSDGLSYSLHDTVLYAGTETVIHYKNHIEAMYCIEGDGEIETLADGVKYPMYAGRVLVVDKHEKHCVRAKTDLRFICVFTPALTGKEVHDKDGSYPVSED
jgi:L-ectoine synthase